MNLLAAILVRVQDAVFQYQKRDSSMGRRQNRDDYRDEPDRLTEAQQLIDREVQRVASAWDEHYAEVRSRLTPEDYQVEVLAVEKSRLHLNRDLRQVLRKAGNELQAARGWRDEVLFVLPIDDFDLSPTSCLHSLRLLRMLSIPNLFCLLFGDLDVLLPVLQLKYASDFQKAYQRAPLVTLPDAGANLSTMALRAAANGLSKLLPAAQRVHLTSLSVQQGLQYAPVCDHRNDTYHGILQLLREMPLASDCRTLFDFLFPPEVRKRSRSGTVTVDQLEPQAYQYPGLLLFSGTNRELTDLWHLLNQLREDLEWVKEPSKLTTTERRKVIDAYQDVFIRCAEEESHKSLARAAQILRPTQVFDGNQPLTEQKGFRIEIQEDPSDRLTSSVRIRGADWRVGMSRELRARRQSPKLFVNDETAEAKVRQLADRAFGAVVILWDLSKRLETKITFLEDLSFDDIVWMSCDWAVGSDRDIRRSVAWIAPRIRTFREAARFHAIWSDLVDRSITPLRRELQDVVAKVAYAWVSACTASLTGRDPNQTNSPGLDTAWWKLIGELNERVPDPQETSDQAHRFRDWLVELAVILSPPSGMLSDVFPCARWFKLTRNQETFLETCPKIAEVWQDRQQEISKKITAAIATACFGFDPARGPLLDLVSDEMNPWGFFTSNEALLRIERGDWNFDAVTLARESREQTAKVKSLKPNKG